MSQFLRACRREPVEHTPIWVMRQAGRYQPQYRELRKKLSFIEMVSQPEIAAQVTLSPIEQFGMDGAILFADILLILEPLGVGFEFTKNDGPRIAEPIRSAAAIDAIAERIDAQESLGYVMETIKLVRRELSEETALIGFAGAPFTLASYMIEGGGSKDYLQAKKLMFSDKGAWDVLMTKVTDATIDYLRAQVSAGVQALQVFDSWVGALSPDDYRTYIQPHMRRLFTGVKADLEADIPMIHFGTGGPMLYPLMREAGGDVIGIDWRVDLRDTWEALGNVGIMGNLDPGSLLTPPDTLRQRAQQVLDKAAGRNGHIFNLGHGIFPTADPDQVKVLVDYVHEASAR